MTLPQYSPVGKMSGLRCRHEQMDSSGTMCWAHALPVRAVLHAVLAPQCKWPRQMFRVDAGINNCTASGSACGPTHGQLQDGQSYLCVSFNPANLDAVAKVLHQS